jgi:hypothetical protein
MTTHTGKVEGGYYLNPRTWEIVTIGNEGGTLPAGKFIRIHWIPTLLLLPILGALFLMFLPFIGFVLIGHMVFKKVAGVAKVASTELFHTMAPGPIPGEAHLTGNPVEKKEEKTDEK